MSIRALLVSAALMAAPAAPAFALQSVPVEATPALAPTIQSVSTTDGRAVEISVWTAADEKGVIVFSHGFGGAPEAYQRLLSEWAAHGFTVVAPLHLDSRRHPEHSADGRVVLTTRVTDLDAVRARVAQDHAGKPLIAAGHSFGSLMSLIEAGAVTPLGPLGDPAVKGVIAISSPGDIPGVMSPDTYATLTTPLLMITGDKDLVPGFADDWRDHRPPFDASPAGDKTLLIFADGDHQLVIRDFAFAPMVAASEAFLDAYALGDAEAKTRLAAFAAPGVTVERR